MTQISYITKGKTDPKDKAKVYFCCHPNDLGEFLKPICEDLFRHCDCAVYYYADDVQQDEDYYWNLSQMQMFVVPVTRRFLFQKNRGRNVEFRYAMKQHIPVLPIMLEAGMDQDFNKRCGNLQYLDKYGKEATAISYEDKLKKFLQSVLIGDDLAKKIRQAFDAYIFLSYRKKDRKYAQELMRLIHRNDFCRDLAIWYDEFLTPGDNFNDSIRAALEKSALFTMAVTPNLVNEPNYVMTEEYPKALSLEKPILPAELVPTDRAMLSEKYPQLPNCVDARDHRELSDALMARLQALAVRQNDTDPQHNFLIGHAYLSGIDVEVDYERGYELILSAARASFEPAIEKLVDMYTHGEGVARDYQKALAWKQQLAAMAEERFRKTWNYADGKVYADRLLDVAHMHKRVMDDPEDIGGCKRVYKTFLQAVEVLEQLVAMNHSAEAMWALAGKYDELADVADIPRAYVYGRVEGESSKACEPIRKKRGAYYQKALTYKQQMQGQIDPQIWTKGMCISCRGMALTHSEHAEDYLRLATELAEALARDIGEGNAAQCLLMAYDSYGQYLLSERNEAQTAEEYFRKGLQIAEKYAGEEATDLLRYLAEKYEEAGDRSLKNEQKEQAWAYFWKSVAVREKLYQEDENLQNTRDLIRIWEKYSKSNPVELHDEYFWKSLELKEAMGMALSSEKILEECAWEYEKLGVRCKEYGDAGLAAQYMEKAAAIRNYDIEDEFPEGKLGVAFTVPLSGENPLLRAQMESTMYRQDGRAYQTKGDPDGAAACYVRAIRRLEQGLALPDYGSLPTDLAETYRNLGDLRRAEGRPDLAQAHYCKALELSERYISKFMDPVFLDELTKNYTAYRETVDELQNGTACIQYERKVFAFAEAMQETVRNFAPTNKFKETWTIKLCRLFRALRKNELDPAQKHIIESSYETLLEELGGTCPEPPKPMFPGMFGVI